MASDDAVKTKRQLPSTVKPAGLDSPVPGCRSASAKVPAAVASVFQGYSPAPLSAWNTAFPATIPPLIWPMAYKMVAAAMPATVSVRNPKLPRPPGGHGLEHGRAVRDLRTAPRDSIESVRRKRLEHRSDPIQRGPAQTRDDTAKTWF